MKKKIVFVMESLQLGGAEKSLVTLLQNLDTSVCEVDLITFHKEGFFKNFVPKEVNSIYIPFPKVSFFDRLRYAFKRKFIKNHHPAQLFWPVVSKYFDTYKKQYDIGIAYNQGLVTYYVADFIKADTKFTWLNTDYKKAGYHIKFDLDFYKKYRKIISVSEEVKKGLLNELQGMNQNFEVEVIKDITERKIITQQSEQKLVKPFEAHYINIVTVARLVKLKGLHLAIEAAKILTDKSYPVKWHIVGEGMERSFLQKMINEYGLQNVVDLVGSTDNPYPYMKSADIYVQTSLFEGLGLTVIEASYLNKPIVSTNFSTVYGILKDDETGLICEMHAVDVAKRIEELINNKDLKEYLSLNLSLMKDKDKEMTLNKVNELFKL